MNIEIHDAALAARIQKLLRTTGSGSVEEVLLHMVETQEEQDRWLLENRAMVNAKIKTGIDQLEHPIDLPESLHPGQAAIDLVEIWRYIKEQSSLVIADRVEPLSAKDSLFWRKHQAPGTAARI